VLIFFLRWAGYFLIFSALAGAILTFGPVLREEAVYHGIRGRREGANLLTLEGRTMATAPVSADFGIVIPKIGANAKVIPEVDAGQPKIYLEALKSGVAHARGAAYPGEIGNLYLFAHSAGNFWEINRLNAVFYLLKELVHGDAEEIFYQGKRFTYIVYEKKIVGGEEGQRVTEGADFPKLTLQTCWPPGTTWRRLLVFGRLQS
jgi:sortase A